MYYQFTICAAYVKLLFSSSPILLGCSPRGLQYTPMCPHHGALWLRFQAPSIAQTTTPNAGRAATNRRLLLNVNRVVVGPPVLEDQPAHREQLSDGGHPSGLGSSPLSHTVVEPGHRRIVLEMHEDGLLHHPPEPPRALLGYASMPGDAPDHALNHTLSR